MMCEVTRNRKLALALNIDPEVHKDDRIPYSTDTLKMFQENIKWAQTQEREFRVFAADDTEKGYASSRCNLISEHFCTPWRKISALTVRHGS
jgi:hypothetical protein